jgi:hypothetical protein
LKFENPSIIRSSSKPGRWRTATLNAARTSSRIRRVRGLQLGWNEVSEDAYVNRNIALDGELHGLKLKRAELLSLPHDVDAVDATLREFCETARAKLEKCHDDHAKR